MAEKDKKKTEDEPAEQAPAPAAPAAGKSKKMLLIIGFVVLLVIAAGVPTVFLVMKQRAAKASELAADAAQAADAALKPEGADDQEEEIGENEERLGMIAPLDTFVVNLSGGKYLRTQIQVEFQGQDIPNKFTARLVPIRDGLIAMLTKKTESDLSSAKGKEDLKGEIRDLLNEQLHKEDVKQVYFTQFVIE